MRTRTRWVERTQRIERPVGRSTQVPLGMLSLMSEAINGRIVGPTSTRSPQLPPRFYARWGIILEQASLAPRTRAVSGQVGS